MTGDIGVVITSFVGVVMILRGLGSIISSESFLQKSDGFNALRVCGLVSAEQLYAFNLHHSSFRRLLAAITTRAAALGACTSQLSYGNRWIARV